MALLQNSQNLTSLFCADPLAEGFDPTTPAPPELSSWLYLFHAYLQMEEAYEEQVEWLQLKGTPAKSIITKTQ